MPALRETVLRFGERAGIEVRTSRARSTRRGARTTSRRSPTGSSRRRSRTSASTRDAAMLTVNVESDRSQLRIEVEDDGRGSRRADARDYLRAGPGGPGVDARARRARERHVRRALARPAAAPPSWPPLPARHVARRSRAGASRSSRLADQCGAAGPARSWQRPRSAVRRAPDRTTGSGGRGSGTGRARGRGGGERGDGDVGSVVGLAGGAGENTGVSRPDREPVNVRLGKRSRPCRPCATAMKSCQICRGDRAAVDGRNALDVLERDLALRPPHPHARHDLHACSRRTRRPTFSFAVPVLPATGATPRIAERPPGAAAHDALERVRHEVRDRSGPAPADPGGDGRRSTLPLGVFTCTSGVAQVPHAAVARASRTRWSSRAGSRRRDPSVMEHTVGRYGLDAQQVRHVHDRSAARAARSPARRSCSRSARWRRRA